MSTPFHKLGLQKPYPYDLSPKTRVSVALVFSAFVVLFLFVFQPFHISNFKEHTLIVSVGYGLVCLSIMLFLNLVFVRFFPVYFDESSWTTGKEIFWTLVNVSMIGLGNFLYSTAINITPFSLKGILLFQFFTLAVGAFPLIISALLNQVKLQKRYELSSNLINSQLQEQSETASSTNQVETQEIITLPSQYAQENLVIDSQALVFIRAADNYIEVFYKSNSNLQKVMLRNSLKAVAEILHQPHFFRCHKSYLVNLNHVIEVTGNAQGYKLRLANFSEIIPVSRSNGDFLNSYFSR